MVENQQRFNRNRTFQLQNDFVISINREIVLFFNRRLACKLNRIFSFFNPKLIFFFQSQNSLCFNRKTIFKRKMSTCFGHGSGKDLENLWSARLFLGLIEKCVALETMDPTLTCNIYEGFPKLGIPFWGSQ